MAAQESRFEIAGVLEQMPLACDFVADIARKAGLMNAIYQCNWRLMKLTNIIEHGYGRNG
jgi:hypothetical protein